jgi:hypothetical protein
MATYVSPRVKRVLEAHARAKGQELPKYHKKVLEQLAEGLEKAAADRAVASTS